MALKGAKVVFLKDFRIAAQVCLKHPPICTNTPGIGMKISVYLRLISLLGWTSLHCNLQNEHFENVNLCKPDLWDRDNSDFFLTFAHS